MGGSGSTRLSRNAAIKGGNVATKTTLTKSEPNRKQHSFRPGLVSLFVLLIVLGLVFSSGSLASLGTLTSKRRIAVPEPQGNGYTYRRTITIDHTKVPNTDLNNFPVLISGTYSYLATPGNGGNVQNANGYDVIFTSDSGCATKLSHEVETYNAATGVVNYWVKVPTLSHTTDTVFYMCYSNSGITTDQSNTTAVWDANYKGVYHLANGTTLSAADSSSNANNGTISNATATLGQMDGAASFNGSNAQIVVGLVSLSTPMTVSLWLKETQRTDGGGNPAYGNMIFFGNVGYLEASSNNGLLYFAGAAASWTSTGYTIPLNTWTRLEFVSTSSTLMVYANGSQVYSTSSDHFSNLNSYFDLATWGQSVGWFHGSIDFLRIPPTQRSALFTSTKHFC